MSSKIIRVDFLCAQALDNRIAALSLESAKGWVLTYCPLGIHAWHPESPSRAFEFPAHCVRRTTLEEATFPPALTLASPDPVFPPDEVTRTVRKGKATKGVPA